MRTGFLNSSFQRLKKLFCKLSFQAGDLCIQCPHNVSIFSLIQICNQYINNTQIIACPLLNRNLLSQVNISHLLSFSDARYYQHSIAEHSNPSSSPQRNWPWIVKHFFPLYTLSFLRSHKSYNVSSESLLLDQLIIPLDIFLLLWSLDCLLDIVRRNSALVTHGNWKG